MDYGSGGITSTRQPGSSFFRRRKTTNSFEDSDNSDNSTSSSSESSTSSIRNYQDTSRSARSSFSSIRTPNNNFINNNNKNNNNDNLNLFDNSVSSSTVPTPLKRIHLKLSLSLIKVRQALNSSQWEQLRVTVRELSSALPSDLSTLGLYLPILARLGDDLVITLGGEEKELGRQYRRGLSKEDAKSLVSLRQKWTGTGASSVSKGKGKEMDGDWFASVKALVSKNRRPSLISRPHTIPTSALLSSLESILLVTSLPKIVLSELDLTCESLLWEVLNRSEEVLEWYLSFDEQYKPGRARTILSGVKSLDLSKNRLSEDLPFFLTRLFPSLETLSLSHNLFTHLPPTITLFPHLRRLKTHGNKFGKSKGGIGQNAKEIARLVRAKWTSNIPIRAIRSTPKGFGSTVESLSNIVAMVLKQGMPKKIKYPKFHAQSDDESSSEEDEAASVTSSFLALPRHLQKLVLHSYKCASCQNFISPTSIEYLPALFEKIHHLDPGVSIPTYLVPPPAPYIRTRSDSQSSISQLSESPSSSTSSSFDRPPHLLSLEEKVFVALLGRGTGLATYIIGDEYGGYSFCVNCAARHLGLNDLEGEKKCCCLVCKEEDKVRVKGYRELTTMRWLRRRPGALKDL